MLKLLFARQRITTRQAKQLDKVKRHTSKQGKHL